MRVPVCRRLCASVYVYRLACVCICVIEKYFVIAKHMFTIHTKLTGGTFSLSPLSTGFIDKIRKVLFVFFPCVLTLFMSFVCISIYHIIFSRDCFHSQICVVTNLWVNTNKHQNSCIIV